MPRLEVGGHGWLQRLIYILDDLTNDPGLDEDMLQAKLSLATAALEYALEEQVHVNQKERIVAVVSRMVEHLITDTRGC